MIDWLIGNLDTQNKTLFSDRHRLYWILVISILSLEKLPEMEIICVFSEIIIISLLRYLWFSVSEDLWINNVQLLNRDIFPSVLWRQTLIFPDTVPAYLKVWQLCQLYREVGKLRSRNRENIFDYFYRKGLRLHSMYLIFLSNEILWIL